MNHQTPRSDNDDSVSDRVERSGKVVAVLGKNFEFKLPLALLYALPRESSSPSSDPVATKIRIRFSVWQNRLPVDALPVEGWLDLQLLPEMELMAMAR